MAADDGLSRELEGLDATELDGLEHQLLDRLRSLESLMVAFSGGVDSAYLAWAAHRALGPRALAVTGISASLSGDQMRQADELARSIGIRQRTVDTGETSDPRYVENTPERCYFCKSELFQLLSRLAVEEGFGAVADGTNADDLHDTRPGRRAARELGVLSPLAELGLDKLAIRWLSRRAGLPSWERPASPCLSSRIPHYSLVTPQKLRAVERAEEALRGLGYREFRVRHHGATARVEISPAELAQALLPDEQRRIQAALQSAGGFDEVVVDQEPFRSGRLSAATR